MFHKSFIINGPKLTFEQTKNWECWKLEIISLWFNQVFISIVNLYVNFDSYFYFQKKAKSFSKFGVHNYRMTKDKNLLKVSVKV
jgi:hypothetical protein